MVRFNQAVVHQALKAIGCPYVWAGRGDFYVRDGQLVHSADLVFDCAGLVGWAVKQAGGPDLRHWWGADHMLRLLPEIHPLSAANGFAYDPALYEPFRLRLYGRAGADGVKHATHVAIGLGNGLVLEAAGGDQTTLTIEDARARGARVRVGFEQRQDFLGERSLLALQKANPKPE